MGLKAELYRQCVQYISDRISRAEEGLKIVQEAANNETKSSAGDKYETGRAMMHLEKEKLAIQLSEAIKMKKALDTINLSKKYNKVELGSIVVTSVGNYFIAISAGQLEVEDKTYYAVSPVSPIGQQLIGNKVGDHFSFAGKNYLIKEVN